MARQATVTVELPTEQINAFTAGFLTLLNALEEIQEYLSEAGVEDDILDGVRTMATLAAHRAAQAIQV